MKPKAILFDLDGTLLPMDQDTFVKDYFGRLARYLAPHGVDPERLISSIWQGTAAMVKNDGGATNEERFWAVMDKVYGEGIRDKEPIFEQFYIDEFDKVSASCGFDEYAAPTIKGLKEMGYRLVLATNPIFPRIATEKRIAWAGLDIEDFELVTTYENSRYSKPNLDYYRDILSSCGLSPEECLMVGNDVLEDMVTEELGMSVYLVTRDLINRKGEDVSRFTKGTVAQLLLHLA